MAGVGRDLWGSPSPTPLPKQGHLQQAAQDLVQVGLEYLQKRRLHNLPGQPVPGLRHPQREEVLPHVQTELRVLQLHVLWRTSLYIQSIQPVSEGRNQYCGFHDQLHGMWVSLELVNSVRLHSVKANSGNSSAGVKELALRTLHSHCMCCRVGSCFRPTLVLSQKLKSHWLWK